MVSIALGWRCGQNLVEKVNGSQRSHTAQNTDHAVPFNSWLL
jgi:hypothetical protein